MLCALCLHFRTPGEPGEVLNAVTIANGHAVCAVHFDLVNDWQTPDGGPLSLLASADVAEPAPDDTSELDG